MKNVEFKNISKNFPGVKALKNISLEVLEGEVLAFLGENGAGKSTFLKIMSGDYSPSSGEIFINGEKKNFSTPKEAIKCGIGVIYQERQIVLDMSVAENLFLGELPEKNGIIKRKELLLKAKNILKEFDIDIDPEVKCSSLSVAHQQIIEILKIYLRNPNVIAFDEPTASLSSKEIEFLFTLIKRLKKENKIIIYVTHRMNEIDQISDKIAIFKDGELVDVVKNGSLTREQLIEKMVGREIKNIFPERGNKIISKNPIFELKNISNHNVKNISFKIFPGEVLGFSGLVGAGRTEIMNIIFGIDSIISGTMELEGKNYSPTSPADAIKMGIGLCPEDRKLEGIIPELSVKINSSLVILPSISKKNIISSKLEEEICKKIIKDYKVKTPDQFKKIVELSGGNQQKIILGRWLESNPKVLILDEPTKGIDIGAKSEFYYLIDECAKKGMAVIVVSSELPEILGVTDRIIVMKSGKITKELITCETNEAEVLKYAII